jgi:hypothetical protein
MDAKLILAPVKRRPGLVLIALLAAGCGGARHQAPRPVNGAAKEAAAVVERLASATVQRNFAVICDDLLTASERRQAGGDQCATLLAERARGVQRPRIRVRRIELGPGAALVHVTTTASGQAPVDEVVRLVREGGRFRVASLGH